MVRRATALLFAVGVTLGCTAPAAGAAGHPVTQTLVIDAVATASFVDKPPAGPSPGDIERSTSKLFDATGRLVGTDRGSCVFTRQIPGDMLERCSETARTSEGTVLLAGVGHLNSMNPPWRVTGLSGAYKGLHGTMIFATDIPLDPNVPIAAGRLFSVSVITGTSSHPLTVGVVPRPAANAGFIRRANAACRATERTAQSLGPFPFSDFDPYHPDPQLLPRVGQFFNQPARRGLPSALRTKLRRLGAPPAGARAWQNVMAARRIVIANEDKQINAALANNASAFVATVYQQARDYNRLVFASAVFGVQSCTFG